MIAILGEDCRIFGGSSVLCMDRTKQQRILNGRSPFLPYLRSGPQPEIVTRCMSLELVCALLMMAWLVHSGRSGGHFRRKKLRIFDRGSGGPCPVVNNGRRMLLRLGWTTAHGRWRCHERTYDDETCCVYGLLCLRGRELYPATKIIAVRLRLDC